MSTMQHTIGLPRPNDAAPGRPAADGWYVRCKAVAEFCFALLLLILTTPIILAAMLLVKLTSRGPAVYSQTRVGRGGEPFTIYKLRTMRHQCESLTGATWCKPGDSRVTPLGRWLRKTHIDELPQLWNVLRSDMSLVGPRPERPEFVPTLEKAIPSYCDRLLVKPGITGLAQVQLPPDTDLNSVRIKLAYDLHYVEHINAWLDVRIHFATLFKMAGFSFAWIRKCCALPEQTQIENAYRLKVQHFQSDATAATEKPRPEKSSGTSPVLSCSS